MNDVMPIAEDGAEFTFSRSFQAPRELVYQSWTDPDRLKHWWGPKGFEWVSCTLDLRVGGLFHYCMQGPAGPLMWGKFVYNRIEAPGLLEYTVSFSDPEANTLRAPFNPSWPLEMFNSVSFTEQDGTTLVTLRGYPANASAEEIETFRANLHNVQNGFKGTLDQLEAYLRQAQD